MGERNWTVVVPVKRLGAAKSRLRGAVHGVPHELLALALAEDTVEAVLACAAVRELLVVTGDPQAARTLGRPGVRIVPEPSTAGLNPAFARGAGLVSGGPVAALTADLPALRPNELAEALRAAEAGPPGVRRFVADAPGTGTVLLTAATGAALDPRFGPHSAAAHASSGARPLTGAWPTLRRDVDTPADLRAAAVLGLGRHTTAVTRRAAPAGADR
ncbi:2-phospho-L-lactate guanylyltransferase [Plantactinospora endophytica]|uniref:Phosphoenolpyruvate guanylyltransferase n=1 Tax=Plantactinospora endophytica TaxID=673535 RepID=A0ABQ4DWL9_9ACTN|nr:2-phospho-L-lactate guanylyltransferase [Plantactinospora endophytica]GIG86477.1 2-phospho-L-lactate guanylyltransferase [Plantactinospora endophytica]